MGNCFGPSNGSSTAKPTKLKEVKFLLLGSGESGKSTFFKQIKIIHKNGQYLPEELMSFKTAIYSNILTTIKILCDKVKEKNLELQDPKSNDRMNQIMTLAENEVALSLNSDKYTIEVAETIEQLWEEPAIKQVFTNRGTEFYVFDGAEHFFGDLKRLRPPNYTPTSEDILHCRRKTTGIVEIAFSYEGFDFRLVDVGGQRSERKKWIHQFEGVTGVIFVAALSDYCLRCYEDDVTNRTTEALNVFDEIVNNQYFKDTPVILLLNKSDLFRERIQKVDIKNFFEQYEGGADFDKACEFIKNLFIEQSSKYDSSRITVHFTCATDQNSVANVFKLLKDTIVQSNLKKTNVH